MSIISPSQVKQLYNISKPAAPVPLHQWKLDEVVAGDVIDTGSSPTNGTNNEGVINQDGFRGKCYEFENNGISFGTSIVMPASYTISCWVYNVDASSGNNYNALFLNGGNDANIAVGLNINNPVNTVDFAHREGDTTWRSANSTLGLKINAWSHIVARADGANLSLYINGVKYSNTAYNGTVSDKNSFGTGFGDKIYSAGNNKFWGKLRDCRIYGKGLNDREINDIYRGLE